MGFLSSEDYTPPEPGYEDILYFRPEDIQEYRRCLSLDGQIKQELADVEMEINKTPTPYATATMTQRLYDLRLARLRNDLAFTRIAIARSRAEMRRRLDNGSARSLAIARELSSDVEELLHDKRDYRREIRLLEAAR